MRLAEFALKRPVPLICITLFFFLCGTIAFFKIETSLFPKVSIPIVFVSTVYPGAGPEEVERDVGQIIEEEISGIAGIKSIKAESGEGIHFTTVEFKFGTDEKENFQAVREKIQAARARFPADVEEPLVLRINPSDQPAMTLAVWGNLTERELYDTAEYQIKPQLERTASVGKVTLWGGQKREIQVQLIRQSLSDKGISVLEIADALRREGKDIPAGKMAQSSKDMMVQTKGAFLRQENLAGVLVRLTGNEIPVTVGQLGTVRNGLEEEKTRAYINGKKTLLFTIYRQRDFSTTTLSKKVREKIDRMNAESSNTPGKVRLQVVDDRSSMVRANISDVTESILFGIALTVLIVFLFLGDERATFVTGLALPTSICGAFLLMHLFGFSINILTLLALSLSVGLLVDDAIVVRENIFRHHEMGKSSTEAALDGTRQVSKAVIATSLVVLAVFGPIGFLEGMVGQFFREFGLTVCFAMSVSLLESLTIAPLLSAYFMKSAAAHESPSKFNPIQKFSSTVSHFSDRLQNAVESLYSKALYFFLEKSAVTLTLVALLFIGSLFLIPFTRATFLPPADFGEFNVEFEFPPGTSLSTMGERALQIEREIHTHPEVRRTVVRLGAEQGLGTRGVIRVELTPFRFRKTTTSEFQEILREQLQSHRSLYLSVRDPDLFDRPTRQLTLHFTGSNRQAVERYADAFQKKIAQHPALRSVDSSLREGSPQKRIHLYPEAAETAGVQSGTVGREIRGQIEGFVVGTYRENNKDFNIRVMLRNEDRDPFKNFSAVKIPNLNGSLIPLSQIANFESAFPKPWYVRIDKNQVATVSADLAPKGSGMNGAVAECKRVMSTVLPLPPDISFRFDGEAENSQDLNVSMGIALGLGIIFIYLVLASLYSSMKTPLVLLLVVPLAVSGALVSLFAFRSTLDLFSMIGMLLLIGVAAKNSILLIDQAVVLVREAGYSYQDAALRAAVSRLRPIVMTSFALIAGMIPIAIGLNEASSQRTSMGIALIGGLVSSTILSLLVIPAVFALGDRFVKSKKDEDSNLFGPFHMGPYPRTILPRLFQNHSVHGFKRFAWALLESSDSEGNFSVVSSKGFETETLQKLKLSKDDPIVSRLQMSRKPILVGNQSKGGGRLGELFSKSDARKLRRLGILLLASSTARQDRILFVAEPALLALS